MTERWLTLRYIIGFCLSWGIVNPIILGIFIAAPYSLQFFNADCQEIYNAFKTYETLNISKSPFAINISILNTKLLFSINMDMISIFIVRHDDHSDFSFLSNHDLPVCSLKDRKRHIIQKIDQCWEPWSHYNSDISTFNIYIPTSPARGPSRFAGFPNGSSDTATCMQKKDKKAILT